MKLNGTEIIISSCISEILEDELILYNEENKIIIVLNETAKIVWEAIRDNYDKNIDIFTKDIASKLMDIYDMLESEMQIVCSDIDETIGLLYQALLLKSKTEDIGDRA